MFDKYFLTKESELRFFFALFVALSILIVSSYVLSTRVERSDQSTPTRTAENSFPAVTLQAKSAYVYDARTKKVLFAKNENTRTPLASLTKVMAALVAEELSPEYGTITITDSSLRTEGDSGLMVNEKWSLKDLLDFSLVSSSNDGIHAIALSLGALKDSNASDKEVEADFVRAMNAKAAELHLKNTYFWNETGLDESEVKGGAYGTARDMATLLEYVITREPGMLEATRESSAVITSLDNLKHSIKNTNALASDTPGLLGSKTGYTDIAGGNLIFVFDPELGRPIIVSVLGSTAEGRFQDAEKLINATLKYLKGDEP
jgi:D-alanyl-D-alanine carboxypeptidase (penicillin-binding protein 5/6)